MAKCPRCSARKAKRPCPALEVEICPVCCAEGRLRAISCPSDCPHLGAEHYQQKRRKERAASTGRRFVEAMQELFPREAALDFAFRLQADIFYYLDREAAVDDATIATVLEALRGVYSPILLPAQTSSPLEAFLRDRLRSAKRYPRDGALSDDEHQRALRALSRHVASLGREGTYRYRDLVASFFGELDFEADLDYSPEDEEEEDDGEDRRAEPRRSPGGLILPP